MSAGIAASDAWLPPLPRAWQRARVRDICTVETGSRDTIEAVEGGGYPFFVRSPTPLQIDDWAYDTEALLTPGDGDVGRIFHHYKGKFNAHQRVYVFHSFRGVTPSYLRYWMMSQFHHVTDQGTAKSTVASLRRPMIMGFPVFLPPLDEQRAIAHFLDRESAQIDAMIEANQQLIKLSRERRAAAVLDEIRGGSTPGDRRDYGVPWLGEIPNHWEVAQIKWLTPVKRGASPRPIESPEYFDDGGQFAWVRIADVTASEGGVLRETTQTLSTLGASLSVPLFPGQLFLSIAGSVGKPCIAGIECCIHDGFVYFPRLEIDPWWLFYIF